MKFWSCSPQKPIAIGCITHPSNFPTLVMQFISFFATSVSANTYPTPQILLSLDLHFLVVACFLLSLCLSVFFPISNCSFPLNISFSSFPRGIFWFWKLVLTLLGKALMLGSITSFWPTYRWSFPEAKTHSWSNEQCLGWPGHVVLFLNGFVAHGSLGTI